MERRAIKTHKHFGGAVGRNRNLHLPAKECPDLLDDSLSLLKTTYKLKLLYQAITNRQMSYPQLTDIWRKANGTSGDFTDTNPYTAGLGKQQAEAEVLTEMQELSQAGYRYRTDDFETRGVSSTFPKWIPEELRSKDLFESTLKHYEAGTEPRGSRQKALLKVIKDEIKRRGDQYEQMNSLESVAQGVDHSPREVMNDTRIDIIGDDK